MNRCVSTILVSLAVLALGDHASAQIVPCNGIDGSTPEFKIVLDDIFDAAGGTPLPLMQSLAFKVDSDLEDLKLHSGLPLTVIRCPRRRPSDPADFQRPLLQQLNARRVVLEIWGTTAQAKNPAGQPYLEAAVGYALIPVRFEEFTSGKPPGAFLVSRQLSSAPTVEELLRLVDQSGELPAYVAVSTGLKLLRAKQYDGARAQLCRAEGMLARAAGPTPGSRDRMLIDYVQQLAADAVTQAKADPLVNSNLKGMPLPGKCQ